MAYLSIPIKKKGTYPHRSLSSIASLFIFLFPGCVTPKGLIASSTVAGQAITVRVDSEWELYYLEEYLTANRVENELAQSIDAALHTTQADPYNAESLRHLSETFSTDFATLFFVSELYKNPENKKRQDRFQIVFNALSESHELPPTPFDKTACVIAFIPGYGYKMDTSTGSDFAQQRKLLEEMGFQVELIETNEVGTVEENADYIAGSIRDLALRQQEVILVSASKGGPEVALALGELLTIDESNHVKAWISVGGILKGSPYADHLSRHPFRCIIENIGIMLGHPRGTIENLGTAVRQSVLERLTLPPHLLTVHYVGAPLSSQIESDNKGRYMALKDLGPNDGLTLLADELLPGGITITELGLDHYFRDPQIDLKTLALTHVVIEAISEQRSALAK